MILDGSSRIIFVDTSARQMIGDLWLSSTQSLGDCVISPDGRTGYLADAEGRIWIVDLASNPPGLSATRSQIPVTNHPRSLALSQDGRYLVAAGSRSAVSIDPFVVIDTARGIQLNSLATTVNRASLAACEDGTVLASSDYNLRSYFLSSGGRLVDSGRTRAVNGPLNMACATGSRSVLYVPFDPAFGSLTLPDLRDKDGLDLPGDTSRSLAVSSTGETAWALTNESLHWFSYDPVTGALSASPLKTIFVDYGRAVFWAGRKQLALDPAEGSLYVVQPYTSDAAGVVKVLDRVSGGLVKTIGGTSSTFGSPDGICLPPPRDTDGDGLPDLRELALGTDPNGADTDADSLLDGFETRHGLDPLGGGESSNDPDGDQLDNIGEQAAGTYPTNPDTDEDDLWDGDEVRLGTDPRYRDSDGDGLTDGDEVHRYGTEPLAQDTDGGGGSDKMEVEFGSDARDAADDPKPASTPVRLQDGAGFLWGVYSSGTIRESTDGAYVYGMIAFVDGDPFMYYPDSPGTALVSADGRVLLLGPKTVQGLTVSRKVYVPEDESFIRYLDIYENPASTPVTHSITIQTELGSKGLTQLVGTSSGDLLFNTLDDALVTDDQEGAGTPPLAHVFSGRNAAIQPSYAAMAPWSGYLAYKFDLTIQPGSRVILMHFASQNTTRAGALSAADHLFNLEGSALRRMTRAEQESVVNFIAFPDTDKDGLLDEEEARLGTDPTISDTDHDGLLDRFEVLNGFNPLTPGDESLDTDADGITNLQEQSAGTDPRDPDTDNDGATDGTELMASHSDPLKPDSDGDTVLDGADNCVLIANTSQADGVHLNGVGDACDDPDGDHVADLVDNCPDTSNPDQRNAIHPNGAGDACDDPDLDGDFDAADNCPDAFNPDQIDADSDTVGDSCDSCPAAPNTSQAETMACISSPGTGSCLESTISLVSGFREGQVQILAARSAVPASIIFEMNVSSCEVIEPVEFLLNGIPLGTFVEPVETCSCSPPFGKLEVNDPILLASAWHREGNNTFQIRKPGIADPPGVYEGTFVKWFRARIIPSAHDPDRLVCLFDIDGGDCTNPGNCGGIESSDAVNAEHEMAGPLVIEDVYVARDFKDWILPASLPLDSLPDGAARLCVTPASRPVLYGVNPSGGLLVLDTATAGAQLVGKTPLTAVEIEYDDVTRKGYVYTYGSSTSFHGLQEFDIRSGKATDSARYTAWKYPALEFVWGHLYGVDLDNGYLWEITPATGAAKAVMAMGTRAITGMAFEPSTGTLYAVDNTPNNRGLLRIDILSRTTTKVGSLPFVAISLESGGDGYLYAAAGAPASDLYRINPSNAAATLIGRFPAGELTGMALVSRGPVECAPFVKHGQSALFINGTCNSAPMAAVSQAGRVECTSPAGAEVVLDGSGSIDPDSTPGTRDDIALFEWFEDGGGSGPRMIAQGQNATVVLPLGPHELTLEVTDRAGLKSRADFLVTVQDTIPPKVDVQADPPRLWPPNHRLVDVHLAVWTSDACGTTVSSLVSVSNNEPDDAPGGGDGATSGDIRDVQSGSGDTNIQLRAERLSDGVGRVYRIVYSATDVSGNITERQVSIPVPHDERGIVEPVDVWLSETSRGTLVQWQPVSEAMHYNLIRGLVSNIRETAETIGIGPVDCLEAASTDQSNSGMEDRDVPAPGAAFFYLVEYYDGWDSGYSAMDIRKPRVLSTTGCGVTRRTLR